MDFQAYQDGEDLRKSIKPSPITSMARDYGGVSSVRKEELTRTSVVLETMTHPPRDSLVQDQIPSGIILQK